MPNASALAVADPRLLAILQSLSDQNRLRILEKLREGERCVCELQSTLGLAQPLLSHHLRTLREAGLVRDRRAGRWVHYSLVPEGLAELEAYVASVRSDAAAAATCSGAAGCAP